MPPDLPKATRRHVLRTAGLIAGGLLLPTAIALIGDTPAPQTNPRPPIHPGLQALIDGNRRYTTGRPRRTDADAARRRQTAYAQHPFAVILGCVDSRVPPEIIFDLGLGDLLTIRTAGPTLDAAVLASIAYGIADLNIGLIVVLGHQRCGAVTAAVAEVTAGATTPPELRELTAQITPAVQQVRGHAGDLIENAMIAHIDRLCHQLDTDTDLKATGQFTVVGAHYQLDTGHVTGLEPTP